jgi:hypothetical protein
VRNSQHKDDAEYHGQSLRYVKGVRSGSGSVLVAKSVNWPETTLWDIPITRSRAEDSVLPRSAWLWRRLQPAANFDVRITALLRHHG